MNDRHPLVQKWIDIIEEILDPNTAAMKKIQKLLPNGYTLTPEQKRLLEIKSKKQGK